MTDWKDPLYQKIIEASAAPAAEPGDYITSLEVTARRGDSGRNCCQWGRL